MKRDFPKLIDGQVALIRAEWITGIVLDENFNYHNSPEQPLYSVFDSFENAVEYIKSVSKDNAEFIIYNQKQEVMLYHNSNVSK